MQKLTATQTVYKFVKANKLATAAQIAEANNMDSSTVAKLLNNMTKRKAVTQVKVAGMRCMYVANKNAKFNAAKNSKSTKSTKRANTTAIVAQLQQQVAQMQQMLNKLQK